MADLTDEQRYQIHAAISELIESRRTGRRYDPAELPRLSRNVRLVEQSAMRARARRAK